MSFKKIKDQLLTATADSLGSKDCLSPIIYKSGQYHLHMKATGAGQK